MFETLKSLFQQIEFSPTSVLILGVGLGVLLTVYGVFGVFSGPDPVARRMARGKHAAPQTGSGVAPGQLVRNKTETPTGFLKALLPSDAKELTQVERQLAQAGITGRHAVRNYYLMRVVLGLVLPGVLVALVFLARSDLIILPPAIDGFVNALGQKQILQVLALLIGIGFFGPALWLRDKVTKRQNAISAAFPNALDLLQISVEAGLGFDAALLRVATEISPVAPEIAEELFTVHNEIRSGREREKALTDMAMRTGVDEVRSFANVVLQSIRFGTSMSSALTSYASEMRIARETRAQEMANKLPVKMSGVMASMMLPALILLAVGPTVIRYIRFFTH